MNAHNLWRQVTFCTAAACLSLAVSCGAAEPPPAAATCDLSLDSLTVTPTVLNEPRFTSCSFNIVNKGPGSLNSAHATIAFTISRNAVFGDADDAYIGATEGVVTVSAGRSSSASLSAMNLTNMTAYWPAGAAGGTFNLFARIYLGDTISDPVPGNNYTMASKPVTCTFSPAYLQAAHQGSNLVLNWSRGVLLEFSTPSGPWRIVQNSKGGPVASPYTNNITSKPQGYYRLW